jgi:hypothetical protein
MPNLVAHTSNWVILSIYHDRRHAAVDTMPALETIKAWASTAASWKWIARSGPMQRTQPVALPTVQVVEDAERLVAAWNERQVIKEIILHKVRAPLL